MGTLKFVLDVGVGNIVQAFLQSQGYDSIAISQIDPTLPDADILSIAERDERMVVTMDKDFGELVFRSGRAHCGVLLLRLEDATGAEKAEVLGRILEQYSALIESKFCVYQNGRLRIRT